MKELTMQEIERMGFMICDRYTPDEVVKAWELANEFTDFIDGREVNAEKEFELYYKSDFYRVCLSEQYREKLTNWVNWFDKFRV